MAHPLPVAYQLALETAEPQPSVCLERLILSSTCCSWAQRSLSKKVGCLVSGGQGWRCVSGGLAALGLCRSLLSVPLTSVCNLWTSGPSVMAWHCSVTPKRSDCPSLGGRAQKQMQHGQCSSRVCPRDGGLLLGWDTSGLREGAATAAVPIGASGMLRRLRKFRRGLDFLMGLSFSPGKGWAWRLGDETVALK